MSEKEIWFGEYWPVHWKGWLLTAGYLGGVAGWFEFLLTDRAAQLFAQVGMIASEWSLVGLWALLAAHLVRRDRDEAPAVSC